MVQNETFSSLIWKMATDQVSFPDRRVPFLSKFQICFLIFAHFFGLDGSLLSHVCVVLT